MPEAFISITTSWASGVGSGNCINSSSRSPLKTTPRIAILPNFLYFCSILNGKFNAARVNLQTHRRDLGSRHVLQKSAGHTGVYLLRGFVTWLTGRHLGSC